MTLNELKNQIELNTVPNSYIVFVCPETSNKQLDTFIASQYIKAISDIKNLPIHYIDNVDSLLTDTFDVFGMNDVDDYLNVCICDTFDCDNEHLNELTNLIIVTKPIKNEFVKSNCINNIIEIPKLYDWQIKDYLYSLLQGVDKPKLDWLQTVCKNDIYKIQQEINKLILFENKEQNILFDQFKEDGIFNDLNATTIFNITNAITQRNIDGIISSYNDIMENKDITEMGFIILLTNAFRNLLICKLLPNPTADSTGLSDKQISVLKRMKIPYSQTQLVNIFKFLSDVDRKIKTGEMWMDISIDYIILKILSM